MKSKRRHHSEPTSDYRRKLVLFQIGAAIFLAAATGLVFYLFSYWRGPGF